MDRPLRGTALAPLHSMSISRISKRLSKPLGGLVVLTIIVVACVEAQRTELIAIGPQLGESTASPPLDPSSPPPDATDAYDITVPIRAAPPAAPVISEGPPGVNVTIPVIVEPTPPPAEWPPTPPPPPVFTPPPDSGAY